MTKKEQKMWVKALCSGEYKQGAYFLQNNDDFCCLGVACALDITRRNANNYELVEYAFLPERIQIELAELNDFGVPFEVIAGIVDSLEVTK